jgi:hypothetical protein
MFITSQFRIDYSPLVLAMVLDYPVIGPGQELPRNLNRVSVGGVLPEPDIYPQVFGWVGTRPWFHFTVPATLAPIKYLSYDRIMI